MGNGNTSLPSLAIGIQKILPNWILFTQVDQLSLVNVISNKYKSWSFAKAVCQKQLIHLDEKKIHGRERSVPRGPLLKEGNRVAQVVKKDSVF